MFNYVVDISHDILEGVAAYLLPTVLQHILLTKSFLSVHQFNERRANFKFDHSAKPPFLQEDHLKDGKYRLNMSEMLNLILALPALVADKVPTDDNIWNLFLSFRDVTLYTLSPVFSSEELPFYRYLIADFLQKYSHSTSGNITIKFHLMTHYHHIITQVGPIVHLIAMRLEGKHRILKQFATSGNNMKNICVTIAKRHQLAFACRCLKKEGILNNQFTNPGFSRIVHLSEHRFGELIASSLDISGLSEVETMNRISINNTLFCNDSIVLCGYSKITDMPIFRVLKFIFRHQSLYYFVCETADIVRYNEHFQTFEVSIMDTYVIQTPSELSSPWPLVLRKLRTGDFETLNVSLRHSL